MMTPWEKTIHGKKRRWSGIYTEYWIAHPGCEVCGQPSGPPHHIRTRGAGGQDEPDNLLALCTYHDRKIHTVGDAHMGRLFPHLAGKILRAKSARAVVRV